jgi:hypothetical protein
MAKPAEKSYEVTAVVEIVVGALGKHNAPGVAKAEINELSKSLRVIEMGEARDYAMAIGASLDVIGISKVLYIVRAMVAITLYAHDNTAKKAATAELEKLKLHVVGIMRSVCTSK